MLFYDGCRTFSDHTMCDKSYRLNLSRTVLCATSFELEIIKYQCINKGLGMPGNH